MLFKAKILLHASIIFLFFTIKIHFHLSLWLPESSMGWDLFPSRVVGCCDWPANECASFWPGDPHAQKFNTHLRISVYYVFTRGPILENLKNAIILTFSNLRFGKLVGSYYSLCLFQPTYK